MLDLEIWKKASPKSPTRIVVGPRDEGKPGGFRGGGTVGQGRGTVKTRNGSGRKNRIDTRVGGNVRPQQRERRD